MYIHPVSKLWYQKTEKQNITFTKADISTISGQSSEDTLVSRGDQTPRNLIFLSLYLCMYVIHIFLNSISYFFMIKNFLQTNF